MTRLEHRDASGDARVIAPPADEGFDERWAAWQAKGSARDVRTSRRLQTVAAAAVVAFTLVSIWLALSLARTF
jgi:hypothetical protein